MDSTYTKNSIEDEVYREYDIPGRTEPYRINDPVLLVQRTGGTTHRVVDKTGLVHCVPAPTPASGVVLRWKSRDAAHPVAF